VSDRAATANGGASWYPRWYWPSFAAPATLFLLVFFLFPFYVVVAVAFGGVSAILREPVPAWNPAQWNTAVLGFSFSNISHTDGLYHAAFLRTFLYVGVATTLCLIVGYPFAYFLARHAGRCLEALASQKTVPRVATASGNAGASTPHGPAPSVS